MTSTHLTTCLRTWLLVAGLTGLLVAVGAAIGGSWLYVFVIAAVLMNLAGYWFSDRLALRASRARPLAEALYSDCGLLKREEYGQAALFALQYALARLWLLTKEKLRRWPFPH